MGTSTKTMLDEIKAGTLSVAKYNDLRGIMENSIVKTLGNYGTVSEQDIHTVQSLLDTGATPSEVLARMRTLPNYQKQVVEKTFDLGDFTRVQYADGTHEDFAKPKTYTEGQVIFDPATKTFKTVTATGTTGTTGTAAPTTDAISLIRKWEGFRDKAYQDSAGVWTIGYGFTNVDGKPVKEGDTMTREKADEMFATKVGQYTNFKNLVKVPLNANQEAALNSFEYNLGSGIWQKSAMPIIDKINAGDFAGAAEYMKKFVYAGGKRIQGLANRREEEASLLVSEIAAPAGFDPAKAPLYDKFLSDKATLPTGMKFGTAPASRFIAEAEAYRKDLEAKKPTGPKVYDDKQLALLQGIEKFPSTPAVIKTLEDNGLTPADWSLMNDGKLPPTNNQVKQARSILDTITELEKHPGINEAVGAGFYKFLPGWGRNEDGTYNFPVGTDANDFYYKFLNFRDTLVLPNLGQLKGPMSDKDVAFLKNTATALDLGMSQDQFEAELKKIKDRYQAIVDKGSAPTATGPAPSGPAPSGPAPSGTGSQTNTGTIQSNGRTFQFTVR